MKYTHASKATYEDQKSFDNVFLYNTNTNYKWTLPSSILKLYYHS